MAEANTIEWMTEQRDRLKQEVDVLNPKLDAATAKLALQERDLAAASANLAAADSELANVKQAGERMAADLLETRASRDELAKQLAACQAACDGALRLAEQRRLALADVLNHASGLVAKVMPLINQ